MSRNAPIATAYAKKSINFGFNLELNDGLQNETELFGKCFLTEDQEEGVKAFLEKRKPKFENR